MNYAKDKGGTALRKMTFQERGRMLKALALHLIDIKKKFYALSAATGATKIDSWIDIEGGIVTCLQMLLLEGNFQTFLIMLMEIWPPYQKKALSLAIISWFLKEVLQFI